nr:hypothetical protein [Tanacetum cinerariifolium]
SPPHNINPLSDSTTSSSPNHLLEEFADELALITFLLGNDDLPFDIESDLREIEYFLNHDPIKEMDYILKDLIDEDNLADLNDNLVDTIPEMFIDEHALDYSSSPLYDEYDDDLFKVESSDFLPFPEYDSFLFEDFFEVDALPLTKNEDKVFNPVKDDIFVPEGDMVLIEKLINLDSTKDLPPPHNINPLSGIITSSFQNHLLEEFTDELALINVESDNENVYDDPVESKEEEIKESKLLIDELDPLRSSDFLPSLEYDSFLFKDFFKDDALPLTKNEDKVFNPGILIQENTFEVITHVAPDKNVKKIAISHASLILEDFDPPLSLYELPFHKEVPTSQTLLLFSHF